MTDYPMNTEAITLNEIRQSEEDKGCRISLGCGIWSKGSRVVVDRARSRVEGDVVAPEERASVLKGKGKELWRRVVLIFV